MERARPVALRAFAAIAFIAVSSFWSQIIGLHGANGISPIAEVMANAREVNANVYDLPTLFWLSSSDWMLQLVCALACSACICVFVGVAPRVALFALWVLWLSLCTVCDPFLQFQWDILLLESSFFMAFFAPAGLLPFGAGAQPREVNRVARFAIAFVCSKVTLESAIVKLAGGDESWRDLTALTYHWWTQPLPTWTSYVLNGLPLSVQKAMCVVMFVLELVPPILVLGPRMARVIGAYGIIVMQAALYGAGNYSYYNVLTLVLALPLLDDRALFWWRSPSASSVSLRPSPIRGWQVIGMIFVVVVSAAQFTRRVAGQSVLAPVMRVVGRFETINAYGAFAHMTKTRPEIVVEGSVDGTTWEAYDFFYKPTRLDERPKWVAPFQPRLDWQMWFAALSSCGNTPFILSFQRHLLLGTPEVVSLLRTNPFPTSRPTYVRTVMYDYRFPSENAPAGTWWERDNPRPYCPPLALGSDKLLRRM